MDEKQILALLKLPLAELVSIADKARRDFAGERLELCSIMNAKSGACAEDCRFCAQSGRHRGGAAVYPLKPRKEILARAKFARQIGADRFDIVTSGGCLSRRELLRVRDSIKEIRERVGIKMCASLGSLDEEPLSLLKAAGLSRYHHNMETSPAYFPKIVSTHTFADRLKTIKAAKRVGLEVCSGGIIGMGETMRDRVQMCLCLKELGVDSVPLNILVPIKGTPLEGRQAISCEEVIRTIAIFRIILKDKLIKIAAGRESALRDFQALGFLAGANGMLIGGYLTIKGRQVEEDQRLAREIKQLWSK